jgi:ectoine hydroxylase-related dioxygenase (phytanoyl-CoA dioxygenase family)
MPKGMPNRVFCEPTAHIQVADVYAAENGLAILTGVLDRAELTTVREAVWRAVEEDRAAGVQLTGHTRIDPDENNIRLFDLVQKNAIFRDILLHPTALHFARHMLGPKPRLSNFSANVTGPGSGSTGSGAPGSGAIGMHADQGYVTTPWPDWPIAVNIIWAVDDFTLENGATRVMPDSVRYGHGPEWGLEYPEATPLLCPAGSIIVMDGRIWHQTGPNTTTDQRRIALFACYIRPWILPQVDWSERVPPALRTTFTPELREILGFGTRSTRNLQTRHGRQIWLDDPNAEI